VASKPRRPSGREGFVGVALVLESLPFFTDSLPAYIFPFGLQAGDYRIADFRKSRKSPANESNCTNYMDE